MTTRAVRCTTAVAVGAALVIGTVTGCSSGSHPAPGVSTSAASKLIATRWWSNSAALQNSVISTTDPSADAAKLHPSRTDYCSMLSETLAAGKSILPGVSAADPALATATTAFVTELQRVAPASVSSSWQTLGAVIIKLADSKGNLAGITGVDNAKVAAAVSAVAADAKSACHLDLSAH